MTPEELYIDLLKKCLTRSAFGEGYKALCPAKGSIKQLLFEPARRLLASRRLALVRKEKFDPHARFEGVDWPLEAETMIGLRRMQNLQECIVDVLRSGVPGDLVETGVWRGGATIFMRGVLKAYGERERIVWVADSFEGLPKPTPQLYPADADDKFYLASRVLAVSLEEVQSNFARYGLLDDQVRFLKGWFKDTLPTAPIDRLAVLRLDGDMYESTIIALRSLYPKLSLGGYVIVDDYEPRLPGCVKAVSDFRAEQGITEKMERTGQAGAYWQRLR
ncbi:MAG TPA: TylF/MycF family methyltransferase [Blastocatellia bacterium]|nr:TylF/MycF family methyltransferase [Blastocatellia bacterium]